MAKQVLFGLASGLGVAAYVGLVAWIMRSLEKNFSGKPDNFFSPVAFLMLFVLSAATVGTLVFGRPVYLFLGGEKREAVGQLLLNLAWLLVFTIGAFVALSLM